MVTSSQAGAQPLTTAGETQQAPEGSSQPVTLSDDAAKITEMVNDPKQVGSVRKAVKSLAGLLNSLAKLRKMRADRRGQENATLPVALSEAHGGIPKIEAPGPATPELEETGTEDVTPAAPVARKPTYRRLNGKEHDSNDTGEGGCGQVGLCEFPPCKRLKREQDKHLPRTHSPALKESLGGKTRIY